VTGNRELILSPAYRAVDLSRMREPSAETRRLHACVRGPIRAGMGIIMMYMLVFGGWGYFVPLAGGVMAPGVINPGGSKKTVQHLEGGIISELRVRDGDEVSNGQPLIVLENVQERAAHSALQEQHWTLLAKQARLEAEQTDTNKIIWPTALNLQDVRAVAIVQAQQRVFETRRLSRATRKSVLRQKIEQLSEQMRGIEAQVQSTTLQLGFVDEELQAKNSLAEKGLIAKPEALRLKRVDAEIVGKRGEYLSQIAGMRQQIGETEMRLLADDAERADQIANEADKVRSDLMSVMERLHASEDVLRRSIVTAPVAGTIINSKFKTVGGVVQRGETLLEIVPTDDALVIEARVTPTDVKAVHKGLPAQIHLSAYSSRDTPRVSGVVESVSADRLLDPYTRESYYLARVTVDRSMVHRLAPHVELIPGMPAEVLITTEHRTMMEYLFKPFWDAFRRSFHEI
jgi:HlyD family secretion protein